MGNKEVEQREGDEMMRARAEVDAEGDGKKIQLSSSQCNLGKSLQSITELLAGRVELHYNTRALIFTPHNLGGRSGSSKQAPSYPLRLLEAVNRGSLKGFLRHKAVW